MCIYKITNKINGKCYIGQTIKLPEARWREHQQHAFGSHINDQNKVLYKAIRKYGLENFSFEVVQDNIQTHEELDKAEIYWINYYNSFLRGYNSTFGGQKYHLILPIPEVVETYKKLRSARKTAKVFGVDHSTIDDILNANNVERYPPGKPLKISKGDFSQVFDSTKKCAQWFIDNNISKGKSLTGVAGNLRRASRQENGQYCGYLIEKYEGE